jgi:hypothetical protein
MLTKIQKFLSLSKFFYFLGVSNPLILREDIRIDNALSFRIDQFLLN